MAIRASVQSLSDPGHAILRIGELDAAPQGLALSIQRQQGPDIHLGDDGWRRTETWLQPEHVERKGQVLEFHLGPEICDRLAGIATVRLRVKEPDIGVVATTVVAWPAMLTSGAVDPSSRNLDDTIQLRRKRAAPPPEPEPEPAPVFEPAPTPPPPPRPELRASRAFDPEPPPPSGRTGWLIAAVAAVLLVGGGYYVYTNHIAPPPADGPIAAAPTAPAPTAPPPTSAASPKKSVREVVGEFFATKPTSEAMLAKARDYAKAGDTAAAFLVFRRAAESGSAPAQLEIATFYDPLVTPSKGGFTPDGARAAEWYERAALAGLPEAQRRLGLLLAKGGAGLGADPGRAKSWLQQAAAQNDAEAKKALDALPR
ncbi:tetratricopeptide repeat protein [Reyranella sp.]|uniref:tetratricopeptide repeat protein n=1 Tax=Reyranella sp. TaxID=1929291 RepID=UPI003783270A